MNKTPIILILILLTIVSPALAELKVTPILLDETVYTGIDYYYNVTFHNNNTVDIYHITFNDVDDIDFPEPFNLTINEVTTKQIHIKTSTSFSRDIVSKVYFYRKRDIEQSYGNFTINITIGFQPNNLEIIEGSQVTWINKDDVVHSVTSSSQIDTDILPNEQFSYTFSSEQGFEYYDKYMNWAGYINVLDKFAEEYVHNSDDEQDFNISLKSILIETTIDPSIYDNNLTVENNEDKEGVIIIKNTGNKTARNITLRGEQWLTFNKANFEIKQGETSYVTFTIHPLIEDLNLTNKDYKLNIDLKGENFLSEQLTLNIFVPQSDIEIDTDTYEWWVGKNTFCENFPTSFYCISEPIVEYVNNTIYKSPPVPYNYTQEDIYNLHKNYNKLESTIERGFNDGKINQNLIITKLDALQLNQTTILDNQNEIKTKLDTIYVVFWIIVIMGIVIILGFGTFMLLKSKIFRGRKEHEHF